MAQNLGTIYAELALRLDKFDKSLREAESRIVVASQIAEKRTSGMAGTIERIMQGTAGKLVKFAARGTAAVAAALAAAGGASIKFGMDAIESENLFEVAMGDMADEARAWSETLRRQLGLNEYEVRRNVGTFYAMFSSMKMGKQASYDMAAGLTQLAYDFASFYNLRPDEAFEKLRSGIMGEVEPLRALGIVIDENTIKTYAYQAGIAAQGEELTQQQKVAARYIAILDQTQKAQGDLARTIDSPTNRLRVMTSTIKETAVTLGTSLMPAFNKALGFGLAKLNDLSDWVERKAPDIQAGIESAMAAVGKAIDAAADRVKGFKKTFDDLLALAREGDWQGVGEMVGQAVVSGLDKLGDLGAAIGNRVLEAVKKVDWVGLGKAAAPALLGFIVGLVNALFDLGMWAEFISQNWKEILYLIIGIVAVPEKWLAAIGRVLAKIPIAGKLLEWLLLAIHDVGQKALEPFKAGAEYLLKGFLERLGLKGLEIAPKLRGVVKGAIDGLKDMGETFILRGWEFMERLGAGIADAGPKQVISALRRLLGLADETLAGFFGRTVELGRYIIEGLWKGITAAAGAAKDKVGSVAVGIANVIKDFFGIASPSKLMDVYGQNIVEGLAKGMQERAGAAAATAESVAKSITEKLETVTGQLDLALQILEARWDLQQKQMASNATQADALAAKQTMLQQQLALVQEKVAALNTAYEQMKAAKGAAAEETQKLYLELLKEQAAQIDLQRSIEETSKAMQRQLQITNGMAYVDQGGYSIGVPLGPARSWDENRNAAEVIAIANRQGVDLSTAASMYDSNQEALANGRVPQYHRGGLFRAPAGDSEGLALLKDRELVLTPEQQRGLGQGMSVYFAPGSIVIPAKDLAEMRGIQDFFARLTQSKRSILGTA